MKIKLFGVLEHSVQKLLTQYTVTAELETGTNHIFEDLHRNLAAKADRNPLKGTLHLNLDNCTREIRTPSCSHMKRLLL